jgi:hypothetical protein
MSDYSGPSQDAVYKFGDALLGLAETWASKIHAADETTQVATAQSKLLDFQRKASSQAIGDPDYATLSDRGEKAYDDFYGQITKGMSKAAQDTLAPWNVPARDRYLNHLQAISDARHVQILGDAVWDNLNTDMQTYSTAIDPKLKSETRQKVLDDIQKSFEAGTNNGRHGTQKETTEWAEHQMDFSDFQSNVISLANGPGGMDAATEYVNDTKNFPGVSQQERNMLLSEVDKQRNRFVTQQIDKAMNNNSKIGRNIEDYLLKGDWDGADKALRDSANSVMDVPNSERAPDFLDRWRDRIASARQHAVEIAKKGENAKSDADRMSQDNLFNTIYGQLSDPHIPPNSIVNEAWDCFKRDDLSKAQLDAILTKARPEIMEKAKPYADAFKTKSTDPKVVTAMTQNEATFTAWVGNNMGAPDEEMRKVQQNLLHDAAKGIADDAVNTLYSSPPGQPGTSEAIGKVIAGEFGPLTPVTDSGNISPLINPPQVAPKPAATTIEAPKALVDQLAKSKLTVTNTYVKEGHTYSVGSDGKTYQYANGNTYWWDGKAWQILK